MTSSTPTIVMFDDQPDRATKAELLSTGTGYPVEFVNLENKSVVEEVKRNIEKLPQPNLTLVDHVLDKALIDSVIHKGSSIVPILREKWSETPIIALTAAADECREDVMGEIYESIIPLEWFSSFVAYAPSIIDGYRQFRESVKKLDDIISLLKPPETDISAISSTLPVTIKRSIGQPACAHHVFRWFRDTFYAKAGFLLNARWTALAIGVSDNHFDKYKTELEKALYTGVFTDTGDPRWWKSRLYSSLLPESPKRFDFSLCEAAAEKLRIPENEASSCYRCDGKWPEVLGFPDESNKDDEHLKPLHLHCSVVDPLSTTEPFYEDRRIMLKAT